MTGVLEPVLIDSPAPASGPRHASPERRPLLRSLSASTAIGLLALAAVLVLHRAWDLLSYPYWLDEAWVALSVDRPLDELQTVTATSPLGWTLLLRLPELLPGEPLRLLPLAFHAAAVVAAYGLGRVVHGRRTRPAMAGAFTAGVIAAAPFLLARDDLKAYTADAFVVVVVLLLVARLDRRWSGRGLWLLALGSSGAMLVSHTAAFASGAALLAVLLTQLARRRWGRALQATAAGLSAAAVLGAVYVLAVLPTTNEALAAYWVDDYLPTDLGGALVHLGERGAALPALLALPSWWALGPLLLAGLAVLASRRLPSVLLTVLLLVVVSLTAGALEAYPVLDQRTSTYLFAALAVVVATGVLGAAALAARAHWSLALGVVLPYAVLLGVEAVPRSAIDVPVEDVRKHVRYLEAVRAPDDVVVVGWASSFAFAYYSGLPVTTTPTGATTIGFTVDFPATTRVIAARDRRPQELRRVVEAACLMAGPGGRVWRSHTHVFADELRVYEVLRRDLPYAVVPGPDPWLAMLTCPVPGREPLPAR